VVSAAGTVVHDALVYDDDAAAAAQVLAMIEHCSSRGGHALVCLPERLVDQIAPALPARQPNVELRPIGVRYGRPIDAIEQLWIFARDRMAAGASHTTSIGELPVVDDDAVDGWLWYEAAVSDVLQGFPLRATCLLDRRALGAVRLDQMTHMHAPGCPIPPMPVVPLPSSPPSFSMHAGSPASARALVEQAAEPYGEELTASATLVISELVTNALRHGGSPADVRLWTGPDSVVVSVTDHGPGVADAAAALRPPDLPRRGAGLWLCHHMADRFSIHNRPQRGCEARAHFDRPDER
jgi:anti-sigma regulatory factor (Ser/Thr protein kinase)